MRVFGNGKRGREGREGAGVKGEGREGNGRGDATERNARKGRGEHEKS